MASGQTTLKSDMARPWPRCSVAPGNLSNIDKRNNFGHVLHFMILMAIQSLKSQIFKEKNSFATTSIDVDVHSFTLCFAFIVEAFGPDINNDENGIQLFRINDESGQTVSEIKMAFECLPRYVFVDVCGAETPDAKCGLAKWSQVLDTTYSHGA